MNRRPAHILTAALLGAAAMLASSAMASATEIRDHRDRPQVRDHRAEPVIRDHRSEPVIRDHRSPAYQRPQGDGRVPVNVTRRDHRNGAASGGVSVSPTRQPVIRDHRRPRWPA
jgi:hypothetical protein